jgi:thiol:disulfide interchange protein
MIALAPILILARIGAHEWEERHPRVEHDLVPWRATLEQAEREAAATGKLVFVDFSADWCAPCRQFDEEVLHDEETAAFIAKRFVPVRVMASEDRSVATSGADAIQERFDVTGFPTLLVPLPEPMKPQRVLGAPGKRATLDFLEAALLAQSRARRKAASAGTVPTAPALGRSMGTVPHGAGP